MENKHRTIVLLWKELGFSVCIEQNGQLVVFCKIIGVFCETVYWLKPNTFFFFICIEVFSKKLSVWEIKSGISDLNEQAQENPQAKQ